MLTNEILLAVKLGELCATICIDPVSESSWHRHLHLPQGNHWNGRVRPKLNSPNNIGGVTHTHGSCGLRYKLLCHTRSEVPKATKDVEVRILGSNVLWTRS